jgi:hypothetical protein
MRIPDDRQNWICSLDRSIYRPFSDAIAETTGGVPFLLPELVLLYKGLETRPKDQADFDATLPLLDDQAKVWLHDALVQARGSEHPWLRALTPY